MKTQSFRVVMCSIIASVTYLNLAAAPSSASSDNGMHFCGFTEQQPDSRRFARSLANLDVGEPRTVRMIYFLPNDRPYRSDVVQNMKDEIFSIQTFFAEQMGGHGYGNKTFRVETDAQGNPVVHRVDGEHPDSLYFDNNGLMFDEIEREFDLTANIYLIVIDNSGEEVRKDATGYGSSRGKQGGVAVINEEFSRDLPANLATHELGHAFGLDHDFRDGVYIMSYGDNPSIGLPWSGLSACHAEFLSVHPYFNSDTPIEEGGQDTIELISPGEYPEGTTSIRIKLRASANDSAGLHQVLLLDTSSLNGCRGLDGKRDAIVEFDYERVFEPAYSISVSILPVHQIRVWVVDKDGNVTRSSFELVEIPDHMTPPTEIYIPDSNLRAKIAKEIGVLPSASIFQGDMQRLLELKAQEASISDLTGLESATNLIYLRLVHNAISDLSPLSGLTNLTRMELWSNNISDISPLSGLTNLESLELDSNAITDISAVSGLTNLTGLWLPKNDISDLTPLSGLTNLESLGLGRNTITDISVLSGLTNLTNLQLYYNNISDISALSGLTNLTGLIIHGNAITDISALSRLTNLTLLNLAFNAISDLSPLVNNKGLGSGDTVILLSNPLSYASIYTHIPALQERGVTVEFYNRTPREISIISGGDQEGVSGGTLANPFIVEVRNEINAPFEGVPVTFAVTGGGGTLSVTSTTTDENGRAESTLTLGPDPGTNTVTVSVAGIQEHPTFTAESIRVPLSFWIISGDNQQGQPGAPLAQPFIVEVRDKSGGPLPGAEVIFSVSSGGGRLSVTSAATDADGRAESVLTLGPDPGTNTVDVSVTGIEGVQSFSAEGVRIPKSFAIVSGDGQEGLPETALADPFVVEVRDQFDKPFVGAQVTFSVTGGGGTLSVTSTTTDENGRAESTLTLGPDPGRNAVVVSAAGIPAKLTFIAEGLRVPKRLRIVSGVNQQGMPGAALAKPLVVEVRDQSDEPFPSAQVMFAVSSGGGTLSVTNITTGPEGRAESVLTLGPDPGTNTVDVSVTGIEGVQSFSAEGVRIPKSFAIVSGDGQEGLPETALADPFVVEVRDQFDKPFVGAQVTFSVSSGGGTLSATSSTTDSNGRAESTLTLGPNPGANTVTVSVAGIQEHQTFTGEGIRVAKTLNVISGNNQQGQLGEALENPLIVEVRDQTDKPFVGAQVTFSVSSGGGTLSVTSAATDADGRADSILTLGPNPGTNTVTVSVAGIQEHQTFTAESIRVPLAFWIIFGDNQQGQPGAPLAQPFIVEVRDKSGGPLPGAEVIFSVSSGGGTLSVTSVTTDANGRAESTLTLGPDPGTNTVEVAVSGIQQSQTAAATAELPPIPEDVNRDDVVNILDLAFVASVLGNVDGDLAADVNGDGVVNILDLVLVAGALGNTAAAPSARYRDLEKDFLSPLLSTRLIAPTTADVGRWLAQAETLDLTDPTSQRGVLFLEQLLAALTPNQTALLSNYPNPFNPETWIPYRLAQDAEVTLTIYDTNGVMVRRLDLGHQSAGYYADRGKAAYWDGRNGYGEQVASGVYFYLLSAGDFSAARKMLIRK